MIKYHIDSLLNRFDLRELTSTAEIEEHLRLRHRIYHEDFNIEPKKASLDLMPHDWNAHLVGIFHGSEQVASIRVVKRHRVEHTARALDEIVRKYGLDTQPIMGTALPSEMAFSYGENVNPQCRHSIVELSRVAVSKDFRSKGVYCLAMLAAMGITYLDNIRYCLYSCAAEIRDVHAQFMPIVGHLDAVAGRDGYAGFKFPRPSVAVVSEVAGALPEVLEQAITAGRVCRKAMEMGREVA